MNLTSKQREFLRKEAHSLTAIVRVGKDGVSSNLVESLLTAIEKRELVKVKILQNASEEKQKVASELERLSKCTVVGIIGKTIIFYKENEDKSKYKDLLKKIK